MFDLHGETNIARPFWNSTAFTLVIRGTLSFVALTVIAMFFYPGGTVTNRNTAGYSFFENFFSDLGQLVTQTGASNTVAAALFFVACLIVAAALALFFLAFPQFFRDNRTLSTLSLIGSILGVLAGLCFVGVAFTPGDILLDAHVRFSRSAFRLFAAAVLFCSIAIFKHPTYPRKCGWALVGFFMLLAGAVMLSILGPNYRQSYMGMVIQATAQKITVYASIISITFQAWGARRFSAQQQAEHAAPSQAAAGS